MAGQEGLRVAVKVLLGSAIVEIFIVDWARQFEKGLTKKWRGPGLVRSNGG